MNTRFYNEVDDAAFLESDIEQEIIIGEVERPSPTYWSFVTSYIPTYKTLAYTIASIVATLPTLPYIFTDEPKDISLEWWDNQSTAHQTFLITSAAIFLGVGTSTCLKYLPEMMDKLKEIALSYCSSFPSFVIANASLSSSAISAIPIAALGYNGGIAFGQPYAIFCASSSFALSLSMRLGFMTSFFENIYNQFDQDRIFQKKLLSHLKHVKKNYEKEFQAILNTNFLSRDIDEKKIIKFIKKLSRETFEEDNDDSHQLMHYLTLALDAGLGIFFAAAFFVLFGQAGYEGIKIICDVFLGLRIDNINYVFKLFIAITTGASALITALITGLRLRDFAVSIYQNIEEVPTNIIKVIIIAAFCGLTAMSLANVAQSLGTEDNIFSMDKNNSLWMPYIVGNFIMSFNLDSRAAAELLGLIDRESVQPKNDIIPYLENKKLSTESIRAIKQYGIFRVKPDDETQLSASSGFICQRSYC